MQKNLVVKALFIIGVLLIFVYGIFGIPNSFNLDGLKDSLLQRVHLGLDLKGGAHLILEVQVNEAVGGETDHAAELLKEQLPTYELSGGGDTYTVTFKASAISELKSRTVEQSVEAISRRVNTLGVSEPVIE